jgi:hypothetical protein
MKTIIQSRGTQLDLNRCVIELGWNRFEIVLAGAARAKELHEKLRQDGGDIYENRSGVVTGLLEMQKQEWGREYVRKYAINRTPKTRKPRHGRT